MLYMGIETTISADRVSLSGLTSFTGNIEKKGLSENNVIKKLRGANPLEIGRALDHILAQDPNNPVYIQTLLGLSNSDNSQIYGKGLLILAKMKQNGAKFTLNQLAQFVAATNDAQLTVVDGVLHLSGQGIKLPNGVVLEEGVVCWQDGQWFVQEEAVLSGYRIKPNGQKIVLSFNKQAIPQNNDSYIMFDLSHGVITFVSGEYSGLTPVLEPAVLLSAENFAALPKHEQQAYLDKLLKRPKVILKTRIFINGRVQQQEEVLEQSGTCVIYMLRDDLEKLPVEKYDAAFLLVHSMVIKHPIANLGKRHIPVYKEESSDFNSEKIISSYRYGTPLFDPTETASFLENGEEGPLLAAFMVKVRAAASARTTTLGKIKAIYDLVALHVARFKNYSKQNGNKYLTFEQLLANGAGKCFEKNGLLVYALQQIGIDAHLTYGDLHAYTRVFTPEGSLEIDVTYSMSFHIIRTKGTLMFSYDTDQACIDALPENFYDFGKVVKRAAGGFMVYVDLTSEAAVAFFAQENYIPVAEVKLMLSQLAAKKSKPHPVYDVAVDEAIPLEQFMKKYH